jgi:hypothetical protein
MIILVTALLAWGVLSFGAVYPWAHGALAVGIAGCALASIRSLEIRKPALEVLCVALLVIACGAQLVSLPLQTLEEVSPATGHFLNRINFAFASGLIDRHSISIDPSRTFRALAFIVFGFTWAWVCVSLAKRTAEFPRALARNLVVLGVIVAVIGLAQRATFNGKLLWFWEPMFYATNAFGPFVNRNHFAGCAVLITAVAIVVMGCTLVWTMSRSGIAAAGVGASILFAAAVYRSKHRMLRVALAGYLAFAVAGIVAWRGTDTLFAWYGDTKTLEWRIVLWQDTIPALKDFWLTGSGLNTYGTLMTGYPHTYADQQPREALCPLFC